MQCERRPRGPNMTTSSSKYSVPRTKGQFGVWILGFVWFLVLGSWSFASDWPNWRGPEQNGVSRETDLPEKFGKDPQTANSNVIWKQPYGGRSTPIVMNGRVYLINDAGEGLNEQERVMCFDADTGKVLWEYRFNVFLTDIVSNR